LFIILIYRESSRDKNYLTFCQELFGSQKQGINRLEPSPAVYTLDFRLLTS